MAFPRKLLLCALLASWITGLAGWLMVVPEDPSLDHDEIYWIGSTYYYDLAFVQRDWKNEAWSFLPARENPPVAKYILGLGLAAEGHHITTIDSLSYFYVFWLGWEKDPSARGTGPDVSKRTRVIDAAGPDFRARVAAQMHAPLTRTQVQAARRTSVVCVALASLLLFGLCAFASNRLAGLIASLLLLFHPIVVSAASRAMADGPALILAIAAATATYWWYRQLARPGTAPLGRNTSGTLLAGVLIALACGAKMNGLILVILAGILVAGLAGRSWWKNDRRKAWKIALHGVGLLAVALIVFCLINPAIMRDFPGGLIAPISEQSRDMVLQADLVNARPAGWAAKFAAVVEMAFFGWMFFAVVLALGVWFAWRGTKTASVRFALCWLIIALVCVSVWLPFAWPRYVLPLLAPSAWIVGVALTEGVRAVFEALGPAKKIATNRQ